MKSLLKRLIALAAAYSVAAAPSFSHHSSQDAANKRELLQDLVTWDQHSLFVRGERLMIFSGEFHPFRLPVPGLWFDVFQKIKSLGFNAVSFYTDWGLMEGNPGHVVTDGIWSLDEFFTAAREAGLYLIARPGPYINAETSEFGGRWVLVYLNNGDSAFYLTEDLLERYINGFERPVGEGEIVINLD
ncbi:hypothetical protein KXV85_005205 [Aspergillus fumigatus]|nr:hypothetical protein KXV85_005205 [Aspergillus fumigatus]